MDNAYIIVNSLHGYLDSNPSAKKLFLQLADCRNGETIPDALHHIFISEEDTIEINSRFFEKKVTEIRQKNKIVVYGLLLEDRTLMHDYMRNFKVKLQKKQNISNGCRMLSSHRYGKCRRKP